MADRLRDSLPEDLRQIDLLIRKALEDPAVRARVEKVLPPEARSVAGKKARPSRPLGVQLSAARGARGARRRQAQKPTM